MQFGKSLLFVALACGLIGKANAMSIEDFIAGTSGGPKGTGVVELYLAGVGAGYTYANAHMMSALRAKPMYCQPGNLSLNSVNYRQMIDKAIKRSFQSISPAQKSEFQIEIILLDELIAMFPCKP